MMTAILWVVSCLVCMGLGFIFGTYMTAIILGDEKTVGRDD